MSLHSNISSKTEQEWKEHCLSCYGVVLVGKYRHYCPDWDLLPIDDTCIAEFACCTCNKGL